MDLGERVKSSSEKIEDHVSYANAGFPVSIGDSLNPSLWNPSMSAANLGLGEGDVPAIVKSSPGWNPSDSFSRGASFLSPNLSHFTSDPAFIQRTARISCLSATSLGNNMANPFGASSHSLGPYPNAQYQKIDINASESPKESPLLRDDEAGEVDLKEDSSSKAIAAKKRKKSCEEFEVPAETKENVDGKPKPSQKQPGKDASEEPKEDYVHVRARRGQATNSHSLAERVRREKISQRMKFLQELVPGCSKVTGKAVMLDEIINYVQSLQRQVEFLSMKLATVNPRADFNLEETLLSKDFLQSNSPSAIGFSAEMVHPQLHPARHGLMQAGISGNLNPPNAFRRATNAQVNSMPNGWDEQLHNVMQMAAFSNNPQEPRTQ